MSTPNPRILFQSDQFPILPLHRPLIIEMILPFCEEEPDITLANWIISTQTILAHTLTHFFMLRNQVDHLHHQTRFIGKSQRHILPASGTFDNFTFIASFIWYNFILQIQFYKATSKLCNEVKWQGFGMWVDHPVAPLPLHCAITSLFIFKVIHNTLLWLYLNGPPWEHFQEICWCFILFLPLTLFNCSPPLLLLYLFPIIPFLRDVMFLRQKF